MVRRKRKLRKKYRRNYQKGGFSKLKDFFKGGVGKDKFGIKRYKNPKASWRRPSEPYLLPYTYEQRKKFYKKINNPALLGLSPDARSRKKSFGNAKNIKAYLEVK